MTRCPGMPVSLKTLAARREKRQAARRKTLDLAESKVLAQRDEWQTERNCLQNYLASAHRDASGHEAQAVYLEQRRDARIVHHVVADDAVRLARCVLRQQQMFSQSNCSRTRGVELAIEETRQQASRDVEMLREALAAEEAGLETNSNRAATLQYEVRTAQSEYTLEARQSEKYQELSRNTELSIAELHHDLMENEEEERLRLLAVHLEEIENKAQAARDRTMSESKVAEAAIRLRGCEIRWFAQRREDTQTRGLNSRSSVNEKTTSAPLFLNNSSISHSKGIA